MLPADAVRIFWVNPVADLRVMNLLEDVGGRVCGTDYLFCHALDPIPTVSEKGTVPLCRDGPEGAAHKWGLSPFRTLPPLEALAQMALADPMVGSPVDRAKRICSDIRRFGAQGVVISRIPGASHCAMEAAIIGDVVRSQIDVPVLEIEVPPVTDAMEPTLRTRLEALVETVREQRQKIGNCS